MAKTRTSEDVVEAGIELLLKQAEKAAEKGIQRLVRASDAHRNWRYAPFADVSSGESRPMLVFEWLFGTAGLMNGRVCKIDAEEATGKSSLLYLLYGMVQRTVRGFIIQYETESALMPPDRITLLGCDPKKMVVYRPKGVLDCLEHIEGTVLTIRKEIDPGCLHPIVVAIDSVSGLANQGIDPDTGELDDEGSKAIGYHARMFSDFFRNKMDMLEHYNVILLATGQFREKISTAFGAGKSVGRTTIADRAFKFHASWILDIGHEKMASDDGEILTIRTTKNKMAPKNRIVKIRLYRDTRCWDFSAGTCELLFSSYSPFEEGSYSHPKGGNYSHVEVAGGKSMKASDFIDEFYRNADLVRRCREKWRIYGHGFKFEDITEYLHDNDAADQNTDLPG